MPSIKNINEQLLPKFSIAGYGNDRDTTKYVEIALFHKGKLSSTRPLVKQDLYDMFKGFTKQRSEKKRYYADGLINIPGIELLLADNKKDNYLLVWKYISDFAKGNMVRELKFLVNNKVVKCPFVIPDTYYIAKGNHFEIYCGHDLNKGLELSQLPFPNMTGLGTVCFGNIDIKIPKEASYNQLIEMWMNWYWNSVFAPNDNDKQILQAISTSISAPTNVSAMKKVPIEKTLEELIQPHLL